jgi:hypothetical protein
MSAQSDLAGHVHKLTRIWDDKVETDEGWRLVPTPPLIAQLRQAITPSGAGGSGGSPSKQRLPMDAGAFDAFRYIEEEARRLLAGCSLKRRQPQALEDVVTRYQMEIQKFGEGELVEAAKTARLWVERIEATLVPPRKRRPLQQACPAPGCGAVWDVSGAERVWAVTVWAGLEVPRGEWEAWCSVCASLWVGEDLASFLAAIPAA